MSNIFYKFTTIDDGNLAFHVEDDKNAVEENRATLAKKHGFDIKKLIYMNQVHGNAVVTVDETSPALIDNCDGLITNAKDLVLMVMVADCIPILFMDKKKGVIAAVHAGRNSTFSKIVSVTASKMIDEFSCLPKDIEVVLGPSIQKCCYEVSLELVQIVKNSFGEQFVDGRFIDLQGINKMLLEEQGIKNITISDICTKCSNQNYFSYRLDKSCGRFAGIISIKS